MVAVNPSMRERLLEAATELFYAQGLRAVSADKVIDRVGTTKVTFYRHFRTKDDLIVAYLEQTAALERQSVGGAIAKADGDVDEALRFIGEEIGKAACAPGFRGCAFINAAAEYPDPESPVRRVVDAHRSWYQRTLDQLISPLDLPDRATAAETLLLLRDGAMIAGYLGEPSRTADAFLRGCDAVIHGGRR
ncbi:TetR/AcrR family transcriptional regulator [Umezawaea endophytica]|uniref:TetR/AcrR family transcriptional regulator n=1 Tax=Umezawaea endophytica TaxID=1654476 RepID=A0A9X2VHF5_9PSEU|nr:TetR/AcrR family transcriptional regulator [Umezawaea endophytica]MCS7476780.1 TetR/AcrR family transcriptional regulator [Umezawaea endophytica]